MSAQEQVEKLILEIKEIFELDELESKIYLNLLRTGPITASAMAKNLNVDRAGLYRAVERMVNKNIITSTLSSPKLLTPIEPNQALKHVLEKKEGEIKKIQHSGKTIIEKINRKIITSQRIDIPTLKIIQGRNNIYREIGQIIENCNDTIFIATNVEDLISMSNSIIPEKIKTCKTNGGKVFLLVDGNKKDVSSLEKEFNATETRICNLPSKGRMIVQKNTKMIMSDSTKFSSNDTLEYSVSTNAIDMIGNIYNLCRLLWKSATPSNCD